MKEMNAIKLTSLTTKGGCGCKIGPSDLEEVLRLLPPSKKDPNLLVGLDTSDDAGVYKISDDLALVQTVDFFTPIVNDPIHLVKSPLPMQLVIFMQWVVNL